VNDIDDNSEIDEGPLSVDLDELGGDDDETDVLPCPACGEEIYEDADQCPSCGHYFTAASAPASSGSLWWWLLLAVAAGLALGYLVVR